MMSASGEVLYVGKARNLRNRVQSYARATGHTNRIARMIAMTTHMELVTTRTEAEALLLEANLIKRLKPRFNVVLRDDKSFPYILIARDHPIAQLTKHRGARSRKGEYFGPFASAGAVNRTITLLEKAFLLRSCSDAVLENRTRPCLLHQIKRCSAPCTGEISKEQYDGLVDAALGFLSGKSQAVANDLAARMDAAAEQQDYERAAIYRDRIAALSHVRAHQGVNPRTVAEADVFGLAQDGGQTCIQVFFFRSYQNWGNRAYFPRADSHHSAEDILEAFIAQFYDNKPCPGLILVSHEPGARELLETALTTKAGRKVALRQPRRGEKKELVDNAIANAQEALARRLAESGAQTALLDGMARVFGLQRPPRRIEVYDNSHTQGEHAVGAMIVAGPEGFAKAHYRKFNIRSADMQPGDDYAMMREVLSRRFTRLNKDHSGRAGAGQSVAANDHQGIEGAPEAVPVRPDLILLDGGQGQLTVALEVMAAHGVADIPVAAIAKGPERNAGREHFYLSGRRAFMLEPRDPVLYYVQRLRDEAHRFAIGGHRARRGNAISASPLDDIAGIGPGRKKALLRAFGSAHAVSRASTNDLARVDGISESLARAIYDHFHEGRE